MGKDAASRQADEGDARAVEERFSASLLAYLHDEKVVQTSGRFTVIDSELSGRYPTTVLRIHFSVTETPAAKFGMVVPIWEPGESPVSFNTAMQATDAALRWDEGFKTGELPSALPAVSTQVVWLDLWEDWS